VNFDAFGDSRADRHPWIERTVRILKNNLDASPEMAQLIAIEREDVHPVKDRAAAGRLLEPKNRASDRGLPAA
jgi:hypothetical protein